MFKKCLPILLISTISLYADTYLVKPDGTGDYPTIQEAVDIAIDGDEIILAPGEYIGEGNRDIYIYNKEILVSGDPENRAMINCQGTNDDPHRAFFVDQGNLLLKNVEITNGYGLPHVFFSQSSIVGGGIFSYKSSLSIENSIIRNCLADRNGAGIYGRASSVKLKDTQITSNRLNGSSYGAGIYSYDCNTIIERCIFNNNFASSGAGVATWCRGTITINDTLFESNQAKHGSAIDNNHCKLYLDKSKFIKNVGKVITSHSIYSKYCKISNSIFSDNTELCVESSDPDFNIDHCTFMNNKAIEFDGDKMQCTNSIFFGASMSIGWSSKADVNYCCFSEHGLFSSLSSSVNISNNLIQNPLLNDNFEPLYNSPCLDAGSNTFTVKATDYYGNPRIINRTTDIGAIELDHAQATVGISPPSFHIMSNEAEPCLTTETLHIFNSGESGSVDWEIVENCPWLDVDTTSGYSDIEGDNVTLSIDPNGLARGKYCCDLILVSGNFEKVINVDLTVNGTIIITPREDVQAAIDIANDGDIVYLTKGVYQVDSLTFSGKKITLQGEDIYSTILEPECYMEYCSDIFYFRDAETHDSRIMDITITGSFYRIGSFYTSSPSFKRCIFKGYYSTDFHTMIYGDEASLLFEDCIFANNILDGDLMEFCEGDIEIKNCTFIDNSCDNIIWARAATVNVSNSIFWNEEASCEIYLTSQWSDGSILNISYSDIRYGYSGIKAYESTVNWGRGNIQWNPMIDESHHLKLSSPCINAGNPQFISTGSDIDGHPRISNGRVDIGADEYYLIDVPYDYPTIQEAIDYSQDDAEIVVYPGVYEGNLSLSNKNIILRSYDPHDLELVLATVIDCNFLPGISINSGTLKGFVITNSSQAIFCSGSADIRNCIIQDNTGTTGTAINANDTASITNCFIVGNNGNSIIELGDGSPYIDHCTIADNTGKVVVRSNPFMSQCKRTETNSILEYGTITNSILWNPNCKEIKGHVFVDFNCIEDNCIENRYRIKNKIFEFINSYFKGSPYTDTFMSLLKKKTMIGDNNLFEDPILDNYYLTGYSPCINSGDPNFNQKWLDFDADHLHSDSTDIGADQYQYFSKSPDFDSDGIVETPDLIRFLSQWLEDEISEYDLNYDKILNLTDFSMFSDFWLNPYPRKPIEWQQTQVREPVSSEGNAFDYGGIYLLEGSGYLENLNAHFMYKEVSGDFEITARLRDMEGGRYACAGLMILSDNNVECALIGASQYDYDICQFYLRRYDGPDYTINGNLPRGNGWFKIEKTGNLVMIYDSEDSMNWALVQKFDSASFDMTKVGLFVNSGDSRTFARGLFSDVIIKTY